MIQKKFIGQTSTDDNIRLNMLKMNSTKLDFFIKTGYIDIGDGC